MENILSLSYVGMSDQQLEPHDETDYTFRVYNHAEALNLNGVRLTLEPAGITPEVTIEAPPVFNLRAGRSMELTVRIVTRGSNALAGEREILVRFSSADGTVPGLKPGQVLGSLPLKICRD